MEALAIIGTIVAMIQKYGVPAALQIISDWQMDNPTIEDFEKLRDRVKDPEDYFKEEATDEP